MIKRLIRQYPLTMSIIAIMLLYFAYTSFMFSLDMDASQGIQAGGFLPTLILDFHEYYRLLLYGFVHFGVYHVVVNAYSFYYVSKALERIYNQYEYLIIFLSSLLSSLLLLVIYIVTGIGSNSVVGGLSGVICGFIGSLYVTSVKNERYSYLKSQLQNNILIIVIISLLPGISLLGHLTGFIMGVISTYIIITVKKT